MTDRFGPCRLVAVLLFFFLLVACAEQETDSGPELKEAMSPLEGFAPRLSETDEGEVILSWLASLEEGGHALRFKRHDGEQWSSPRTVAEGDDWFANWADTPGVRAVGDWLFAHWLVRSGPGTYHYDIHAAWSDDGGESWQEDFVLHRDGVQAEHGFLSSTLMADGSLGVAWLDGRHTGGEAHGHGNDNGAMSLRWARFEPGERRALEDVELDDRVCDCCMTATVMESDGPRVFYRDRLEGELRDISSIHPGAGDASGSVRVSEDDWEIAACPVNGPAALALPDRTAVAWYTAADRQSRVYLADASPGKAEFSSPRRLDEGGAEGRTALVSLDDQHLLAVWLGSSGGEGRMMGRMDGPGGLSDVWSLADMATARASGFPVMARQGDKVLLAWTEQDREGRRIRLAALSAEELLTRVD